MSDIEDQDAIRAYGQDWALGPAIARKRTEIDSALAGRLADALAENDRLRALNAELENSLKNLLFAIDNIGINHPDAAKTIDRARAVLAARTTAKATEVVSDTPPAL